MIEILVGAGVAFLVWLLWTGIRLIVYVKSGQYELDRRLDSITKK